MLLFDKIKFNKDGLIPAIAQDAENGDVLMLAYMNADSLKLTLETGKACYYSRSRQKIWVKGESSGHFQVVKEIRYDCDGDTILMKIEQKGAACHLGYRSCFFTVYKKGEGWVVDQKKLFDPKEVYKK